jgi:hypothetical protein
VTRSVGVTRSSPRKLLPLDFGLVLRPPIESTELTAELPS